MDAAPNFGLSLRWITVTCFEFRFGSLRVVSDPFITDAPGTELDGSAIEACDLITLSHGHWDHIQAVEAVRATGIPAFQGANIGHVANQLCMPSGARAEIDAGAGTIRILEPVVA